MDIKKLFTFLFLGVMLISFVSADWSEEDNYKIFNEEEGDYGKIEVWDEDLFFDDKLAEYKLIENTDYCIKNCHAIGNVSLYDTEQLFQDMRFIENGVNVLIDYDIYISYNPFYEAKTVKDYYIDCVPKNGGKECTQYYNGTKIVNEYNYNWTLYNGEVLNEGDYVWMIKGVKSPLQKIDWIGKAFGLEFEEWAVWDTSWNEGLKVYYTLNESSGPIAYESTKSMAPTNMNGTLTNMEDSDWVTGKIGNSLLFDSTDTEHINTTGNIGITGNDERTMCGWVNLSAGVGQRTLMSWGSASNNGCNALAIDANNLRIQFFGFNNEHNSASGTAPVFDDWAYVCLKKNSTGLNMYYNGSLVFTNADTLATSDSMVTFGRNKCTPSWQLTGALDEAWISNRSWSDQEILDSYGDGEGTTYSKFPPTGITTTLNDPGTGLKTTNSNINFNFSVSASGSNVSNATFYIWNSTGLFNQTLFTYGADTVALNQTITVENFLEDEYHWNVESYNFAGDRDLGNANFTFEVHFTSPKVEAIEPNQKYIFIENGENLTLEYNITEEGQNLTEHLDSCWFIYNNTRTDLNCSLNSYNFTYITGVNSLIVYANDTFSFESNDSTSWSLIINNYVQDANYDIVGEGTDVTFNLTINYSTSHTGVATFHIDNSSYPADNIVTLPGLNFYEKTLNIQDGFGNATGNTLNYYWNYNVTNYNDSIQTTNETLIVYAIEIDDCSSYGDLILNLTLLDEATLSNLPEVNQSSNVEVDLRISGVDNPDVTWDYSNTYANETNPKVCIPNNILNFSSYKIDFTIGYDATDHVQEFYYMDNGTLDDSIQFNSYTNKSINIYDLLTVDSTTFLFNFFNRDGLAVDNAIVHTFRRYIGDGEFLEVERSKQDNNGETHMHLVEEDVIYYFMITQNGNIVYISEEYNALCETLPCTITLTETGEFEELPDDYSLINGSSLIINNVTSRTSTYVYSMNAPAEIEYVLYKQEFNGTVTEIDSDSAISTSGTLTVDIPLHSGNVSYFTTVYKQGGFVESQWIDLDDLDASDFFGVFLAVFLGFLITLALVLMAITEKTGTVLAFIGGLIFTSALGLTRLNTSTGQNLTIYAIIAGGIIIFKLAKKRS